MIFEAIFSGSASVNAEFILTLLYLTAISAAAVALSALFSEKKFSLSSVFAVLSLVVFGATPISQKGKSKAAPALLWLIYAATAFVLCGIVFPLTSSSLALTAGALFFGISAVNVLPLPGFLCFSFLKNVLPEKFTPRLEEAERFSAVFIIFVLILFARSGAVYAVSAILP